MHSPRIFTFKSSHFHLLVTIRPFAVASGKFQTLDKGLQATTALAVRAASHQWHDPLVDDCSDQFFFFTLALQFLDIRPRGKGRGPRNGIAAGFTNLFDRRVGQRGEVSIEVEGEEDGCECDVAAEVGEHGMVGSDRKGGGIAVQGPVGAGVIDDCRIGQTSNELVDISDSLGRAESVSCSISVVFT